uniref:Uncharacterized protein n=1 Tax=Cannabis sativa TaxID=3483 RepID=A0A803NSZ8_CANSA
MDPAANLMMLKDLLDNPSHYRQLIGSLMPHSLGQILHFDQHLDQFIFLSSDHTFPQALHHLPMLKRIPGQAFSAPPLLYTFVASTIRGPGYLSSDSSIHQEIRIFAGDCPYILENKKQALVSKSFCRISCLASTLVK